MAHGGEAAPLEAAGTIPVSLNYVVTENMLEQKVPTFHTQNVRKSDSLT